LEIIKVLLKSKVRWEDETGLDPKAPWYPEILRTREDRIMRRSGVLAPELRSRGWRPLLLSTIYAICSWAAVAPCLAQASYQPMLKLHDRHVIAAGPRLVSSTDDDVLILFDGHLSSTAVTRQLVPGAQYQTRISLGSGPAAAFAALKSAFAAGRPGLQNGACSAELLPLGSSFRYQITWFGRQGRVATFTLTNQEAGAGPCTPAQIAMATAVLTYEAAVLAEPGTTLLRSSCASDADCPAGQLCCYPCGIPGCTNQCTPIAAGEHCPLLP
jgi:hypothetical protein